MRARSANVYLDVCASWAPMGYICLTIWDRNNLAVSSLVRDATEVKRVVLLKFRLSTLGGEGGAISIAKPRGNIRRALNP